MTPDMSIFMNDPWWIVLIKVVGVVVLLLTWTIFNVWYERRLVGKMQHRLGPIMNGPFGLGQALGDGLKLLFKEDFAPGMVDRVLFTIAPVLAGVCAFTAWSVIPLGGEVNMFGVTTRLQVDRHARSPRSCSWPSPRSASTASCWPAGRPTRRTRCWAPCAPRRR
jgi:NADH-quinone oxidoreductase subunit H